MPKCLKLNPYKGMRKSPVVDEYVRVVTMGPDGSFIETFEKVIFPLPDQGTLDDWSLDSLFKAGINPNTMNIRTEQADRMEINEQFDSINAYVDDLLAAAPDVESSSVDNNPVN